MWLGGLIVRFLVGVVYYLILLDLLECFWNGVMGMDVICVGGGFISCPDGGIWISVTITRVCFWVSAGRCAAIERESVADRNIYQGQCVFM
jgi:hypothetical protein